MSEKEIENDKVLEDGRHILFVNLNYEFGYDLNNKMNDLKHLFNDLNESEPSKIWYTSFRNKMNLIKNTEGGRADMELKYNSIFLKGENQGKEVEKEKWRIKIISYGLKQNQSLEEIASIADVSVEEVKQYIKDNRLKNNQGGSTAILFYPDGCGFYCLYCFYFLYMDIVLLDPYNCCPTASR